MEYVIALTELANVHHTPLEDVHSSQPFKSNIHTICTPKAFEPGVAGHEMNERSEKSSGTVVEGLIAVFTVLGAVAELERSLIVERVRAGMRNARAKGKRIGRPPLTFLSEETRQAIALARQHGEGSLRELASRFHTSVGTVQRCIRAYQTGAPQSPRPPGS